MQILAFVLVAVTISALVLAAAYMTSSIWLPTLYDAQGDLDRAALLKVVLAVPGVVTAIVGGVLAGLVPLLVASYQRSANLELEQKKGRLAKELEEHKNNLTSILTREQFDLDQKRAKIEERVAQLTAARELASEYRFIVSEIRRGDYRAEETSPYRQELVRVRDSLEWNTEIYNAWCEFVQLGHYLEERASNSDLSSQASLWIEPSPQYNNRALGLVFVDLGQRVLSLLEVERADTRGIQDPPAQGAGGTRESF